MVTSSWFFWVCRTNDAASTGVYEEEDAYSHSRDLSLRTAFPWGLCQNFPGTLDVYEFLKWENMN